MADRAVIERPAPRPAGQAREAAASRLLDTRPAAVAQRKLMTAIDQAPRVAALQAISAQLHARSVAQTRGTVQRVIHKARTSSRIDEDKRGKFYSDFEDEGRRTYFASAEDAKDHENSLKVARAKRKEQRQNAQRETREKRYRQVLKRDFAGYEAPKTDRARLFQDKDKRYNKVNLVAPSRKNIKRYSERIFAERKARRFKTQVLKLGGEHYVLAPGTDIGLTAANLRPDLIGPKKVPKDEVPLSRVGTPKTYDALASGLDDAAKVHSRQTGKSLRSTYKRIGKDVDRASRGSAPAARHAYSRQHRRTLQEFGTIIRLDKGRVPKSTRPIRRSLTSGRSFTDLLIKEKYPGAGTGGVKRLRGVQEDDGNLSEGSDIDEEEVERRPAKKRQRIEEPTPAPKKKASPSSVRASNRRKPAAKRRAVRRTLEK